MAKIEEGTLVKALRSEHDFTAGHIYAVYGDDDCLYVIDDEGIEDRVSLSFDNMFEVVSGLPQPSAPNMVDSPPHYNAGKYEVIDIIEDSLRDIAGGFEAYCLGNVEKYTKRYRHKNGVEDLRKAAWYLNKAIEHIEARS